MSKLLKVLPILCALLLFVTACEKEEVATDTAASETTATDTTDTAAQADAMAAAAESPQKTKVQIHILGTAALIEQDDPAHPVAIVLPKIGAMTDGTHEHVPYVAWLDGASESMPTRTVRKTDPAPGGANWVVRRLDHEGISVGNTVSSASPVTLPDPATPCPDGSKSLTCIPRVADFLGTTPDYNEAFVKAVGPSSEVAGRLEIGNGTLSAEVKDLCKWEITSLGAREPVRRNLASEIMYEFEIPDETLTLKVRNLDDDPGKASDLVTIKRAGSIPLIEVRFGNAVDIFPGNDQLFRTGDVDQHFDNYYKFYERVLGRPLPKRTTQCGGGPSTETIYCGPGWVPGRPKP